MMTRRSEVNTRERFRGELVLCFVAMTWGTTYIAIQDAMAVWPPMALVAIRFALAFFCVLPALLKSHVTWSAWLKGSALGIFIFLTYGLQNLALANTTSPRVAFAAALVTVFVPVFSWIALRTRWRAGTYLAVVAATAGVYGMCGDLGAGTRFGDLLAVGGAIAYTIEVMLLSHFTRRGDTPLAPLLVAQFATTSILAAAASWAIGEPRPAVVTQAWEVVAYLGLITTGLCLAAQMYGQSRTTPTRAAFIYALEPISAAVLAWMLQGQRLNRGELIGGALILLAAVTADQALPAWRLFRRGQGKVFARPLALVEENSGVGGDL